MTLLHKAATAFAAAYPMLGAKSPNISIVRSLSKCSFHRLCLSTAMVSILGAPVQAQQVVADGNEVDVPAGTIVDTTGQSGLENSGLQARNQGKLTANGVTVITSGEASVGVLVRSNSQAIVRGSSFKTSGLGAYGVYVLHGGSSVTALDTVITTTGRTADGVHVYAATVSLEHSQIETSGESAKGIFSSHSRGSVTAVNTMVKTMGTGSVGLWTEQGGGISFRSGSIYTKGQDAHGVSANGTGSTVTVTGTMIGTLGGGSNGIRVEAGGHVTASGATIKTGGDNGDAISAQDAGAQVDFAGGSITTTGGNAHGVRAEDGSVVNLQRDAVSGAGTLIKTSGTDANGISATSNSIVSAQGLTIQVDGNGAGVLLNDGASASFAQSAIRSTTGPALQTGSGDATFTLSDGTTVSSESGILFKGAAGSNATITADSNVTLIGDMVVAQAPAGGGTLAASGTLQTDLKNGSSWKGAASGMTGASIDGSSRWLMSASSDVGTLSNDGTVEFDAASPYKTLTLGSLAMNGGSFILNTKLNEGGAVTETDSILVTGDTTGSGVINIRNNGGTGAYTGTGATDGIQIVQIGGASDAEFKLGSAAVVGIYDYQLNKADGQNWYLQTEGKDDVNPPVDPVDPVDPKPPVDPVDPKPPAGPVNPGNPVNPDSPGNPGNPVDPIAPVNPVPGTGTGHVVDIVPGYNIALSAAQNHVLTSLDTFHERLGELRAEDLNDGFNVWMRGIGKTGSYSPNSVTGYNGHGFDMTTTGVQIGADYSRSNVFMAGDKFTVGMFGEYANSNFDVRGRTAHGSISSKGLGGYVTWQQKAPSDKKPGTGAYVDAVVKQDWLNFGVSAKSVSGFDLQNGYKGKATSASIETGYGFDLGNNVVLQPSAQLTWSKVKADNFTDPYGIAVHGQEAESLIGRVGVRLEETYSIGEEETVETGLLPTGRKKFVPSMTIYMDANVKYEFKGKNGLVASSTAIGNDMGGTRYDFGAGEVVRVSENVSLFGRGSVEFGGSTNVAGKASGGFSITW